MKLNIEYSYRGKKYKSLEEAFSGLFERVMVQKAESYAKSKLEPFAEEISKSGGRVVVHWEESTHTASILLKDIPEPLSWQLKEALKP